MSRVESQQSHRNNILSISTDFEKDLVILRHELDYIFPPIPQKKTTNQSKSAPNKDASISSIVTDFDQLFCRQNVSSNEFNEFNEKFKFLINFAANKSSKGEKQILCLVILYFVNRTRLLNSTEIKSMEILKNVFCQLKSQSDEVFAPLIFFVAIFFSNKGDDPEIIESTRKIPVTFDIFRIVQKEWLKPTRKIFSEISFRIFNHTVYFAIQAFLVACQKISEEAAKLRIVPLLMAILRHQAQNDTIGGYFFDFFLNFANARHLSALKNYIIPLVSVSMKSSEKARSIWELLKKNNLVFVENLQECHLDLVSTTPLSPPDRKMKLLGSFKLLYKFCKYLEPCLFDELTAICFELNAVAINTDIVETKSNFLTFLYFIADFLWSPKYYVYASKIIEKLTQKNPTEMITFYNQLFDMSFPDVVKIIDNSCNDHRVVLAFLKSAHNFISFYFRYQSPIKEIPNFVYFFVFEYFHSVIYRKFLTEKAKWKVLSQLVKISADLILCDKTFVQNAHENRNFVSALITVISISSRLILTAFSKKEKHGYKDITYQLKFTRGALSLLQDLISAHFTYNYEPSYLYHALFDDKWTSELISSLAKFLPLSDEEHFEFDYYLKDIRECAFNLIELMCVAAYKIGIVSFEAYYPEECQRIFDSLFFNNLNETKNEISAARILDFVSNTIETQQTFAYSFVRQTCLAFITSALINFDPKEVDWTLFASVTKLVSKLFINLNSNSIVIQKLTFPEKVTKSAGQESSNSKMKMPNMNPTQNSSGIESPSSLCKGISPVWCKIIDFIFDFDDKFEITPDRDLIFASKARLLKAMICIFLNVDSPFPSQKIIGQFFNKVFKFLIIENAGSDILPTVFKIDFTRFRNISFYPKPDQFYIDTYLVKYFLNEEKRREDDVHALLDKIEKMNKTLYSIDLCTELLTAIHSLIRIFVEVNFGEKFSPEIPKPLDDDLIGFMVRSLDNPYIPNSTVECIFNLYETILLSIDGDNLVDSECNKIMDLFDASNRYLKITPNTSVFRVLTEILQLLDNASDYSGSLIELFNTCCHYMSNNTDINAAKCAIEISYVILDIDDIFYYGKDQLYISFVKHLIGTELAIPILRITRILCQNEINTERLEKAGFFNYIISDEFTNNLSKESKLWPYIFSIFLSLPPNSPITVNFICTNFHVISFYLTEQALPENELMLFKAQEGITDLIAHISTDIRRLQSDNPSTFRALIELVYRELKSSYYAVHEKTQEKLLQIFTNEIHNSRSCNILILQNCLYTINNLLDFPFGDLPKGFQNDDSEQTMMDLLANIMTEIAPIASELEESKDSFLKVILRSIEMASRIYCTLSAKQCTGETNSFDKDKLQHIKDSHSKVSTTLNSFIDNLIGKGVNLDFIGNMLNIVNNRIDKITE